MSNRNAAKIVVGHPRPHVGLRFHSVRLNNALCDGKESARYIAPLKARGYCFVASDRVEEIAAAALFPHTNLPARLIGMFGRERGRAYG
jgi:hypothetical protein